MDILHCPGSLTCASTVWLFSQTLGLLVVEAEIVLAWSICHCSMWSVQRACKWGNFLKSFEGCLDHRLKQNIMTKFWDCTLCFSELRGFYRSYAKFWLHDLLILRVLLYMVMFFWISGDMDGATALLHRCLEQDSTSSDCHVLMAQVQFSVCSTWTLTSQYCLSQKRNLLLNYLKF